MNEPEGNEKLLDDALEGRKKGLPKQTVILLAVSAAIVFVAVAVGAITWSLQKPDPLPEAEFPTRPSAQAATQAAATSQPGQTDPTQAAQEAGLRQAVELYNASRYTEAAAMLDTALRENSESGQAYMYRGLSFFWLNFYDKAVADLTQALRRAPQADISTILTYRGAAYVLQKMYPEAVGDLTRAIELNPGNLNAYSYRASAYSAMGRTDLAAADTARAGGQQ